MALAVDLLTLFPGMFTGILSESIIRRAREAGVVEIGCTDIRDYSTDRHRSVDDRPYGGGPGMVFKPEPVFRAVEAVLARRRAPPARTRKVILTPQGKQLRQGDLREFASAEWLVLLCGHYEGFDERIHEGLTGPRGGEASPRDGAAGFGFEEYSIGDYILSGGEVPAMVILDGVVRLLPGALGDANSAADESFEGGLLEYPHYTRPPVFRGMDVPEVLLSGDHGKIEAWRKDFANGNPTDWCTQSYGSSTLNENYPPVLSKMYPPVARKFVEASWHKKTRVRGGCASNTGSVGRYCRGTR